MGVVVNYLIIGIMIYICIYAIVERICKCKEQCAIFEAAGVYFAAVVTKEGAECDLADVVAGFKKAAKED